jgi:hypothetical protein
MNTRLRLQIVILALMLILNVSMLAAYPFHYKVNAEYDYNSKAVSIGSVEMLFSQIKPDNVPGLPNLDYMYEIRDFNNNTLIQEFFMPPSPPIGENLSQGYIADIQIATIEFSIYSEYFENAKELIIYNEKQEEVAIADLSIYSREKISEDVSSEGAIVIEQKPESRINLILIIAILVLVIVIIIAIIYYTQPDNKKYR